MDSVEDIENRATAWLAHRDSGEWTDGDEARLQQWLAAAPAHRIAFLRFETVWEESQRLKALAAGLPPDCGAKHDWTLPLFDARQPAASAQINVHASPAKSRCPRVVAFAASVLIALGAGYAAYRGFVADVYTTKVGVVSVVPLRDGSSITLNTASAIRIDINDRERRVDLTQGEAFFDVAKEARRPFVVTAGMQRVVAVGTRFSVRRDRDDLRVVVTEGTVEVEGLRGDVGNAQFPAGTVVDIRDEGVLVRHEPIPRTEEVLSWRTGYLTFRDTPLAEAIHEFNQYNRQQMVTADPALASIPLTGKFKATNYDAFVRLLEDGYSIQAQRKGNTIVFAR